MSKAVLMQGNEACAEGAIAAGVRFFAGYPITPSTEIAEQCSVRLPQEGGHFIQIGTYPIASEWFSEEAWFKCIGLSAGIPGILFSLYCIFRAAKDYKGRLFPQYYSIRQLA